MAWYKKYLSIYEKPFKEVPDGIIADIRGKLSSMQSDEPLVSVVVIAYNEAKRLSSCLWSLSDLKTSYPIEILGINNSSTDETEDVYKAFGIRYFNEERKSPGFARQCGLDNSRGRYHFFIDADTFYPPLYIDTMMKKLTKPGVSCVGSFWSYYPDENHSRLGLCFFELIRDTFLFIQHFKRPELCIRGMVFAFNADYARKEKIRTDIRRGEDGSLALSLKKYGRIAFTHDSKARPVTGYGTLGSGSLFGSLIYRAKVQLKGISRIFFTKDKYEDSEENLIRQ
ncbi:MAG: glycosyltransferase family A protein [Prevotellaceae bacterium]|nr:glycosyltransferase family A protein [Prevotellaceae bacterium]